MDPQFNLSPELAALALRDFGETPEKRTKALAELRRRIAALPDESQRLEDTSDGNIIRFLRARKYDIDKALDSTVKLKAFRDKFKQDVLDQPGLKKLVLLSKDFLQVYREPNAGKVYVCMRPSMGIKMFTADLKREHPRAMMQIKYWMFDSLSKDPQCQIAGMIICNTFRDLTLMDQMAMQTMAPMSDQTATFELFNILGTRFKGAFIFKQPMMMTIIWFLAKPFMSRKIQERFNICGRDYDRIKTVCADMSILPSYLGGTLPEEKQKTENYCEKAAVAMP